jgi:hypothetical protein
MNRHNIRLAKQRFLGNETSTMFFSLFGCQILAPRNHAHPERMSDFRDQRTDIAEPDNPERLAMQIIAYQRLPAAASHASVFSRKITHECVDQCPTVAVDE